MKSQAGMPLEKSSKMLKCGSSKVLKLREPIGKCGSLGITGICFLIRHAELKFSCLSCFSWLEMPFLYPFWYFVKAGQAITPKADKPALPGFKFAFIRVHSRFSPLPSTEGANPYQPEVRPQEIAHLKTQGLKARSIGSAHESQA